MPLLEVFLDTDVMIDILRGYEPAVEWLKELKDQHAKVCLPGFTVMELIQGCENKEQIKEVREAVQDFRILWPTESCCSKALEAYTDHSLSHGLDILDALIGQMAEDLMMPLHTFNTRHFKGVFKADMVQPYKHKH